MSTSGIPISYCGAYRLADGSKLREEMNKLLGSDVLSSDVRLVNDGVNNDGSFLAFIPVESPEYKQLTDEEKGVYYADRNRQWTVLAFSKDGTVTRYSNCYTLPDVSHGFVYSSTMGRCLDDGTVIARLKPENVQMLAAALFVDGSGGDFRKEHVSDIEAIRARISTIDKENVGNINKAVKGEKEHDRFNALPLWKQKQELSTKASSPDEIKLLVEAIELYKQLPVEEQKGEEISTLYRQLGNIYHNNYYPSGSDFKKAIAYYEEALKWNPDSKEANHNLALTYYRLGMYKKAHEYVKKADSIELQDLIETAIKGEGVNEYLVKLAKLHYTATAEKQSEINAKLPDDCPLLKNPANLLNELERTTLLVDLFCKKNNFGHVTGDINSSFIPKADKRSRRIVEKGLIGMETSNIYITYKDFIKLIKYFNAHQASKKK